MRVTHVLGHNSNWNIEIYDKQQVGDYFLITGFTHGTGFGSKKSLKDKLDISIIDLQFYGKKNSISGKFLQFDFHPIHCNDDEVTTVYFENCIKQAIEYQQENGFGNIIIPHFYEMVNVTDIINTINNINKHIIKIKKTGEKYFMTLPLANDIISNEKKVEEILLACTDMDIAFDGYYITCENKPGFGRKLTIDFNVIKNLSTVFKTLKLQDFKTIYAYANWDAIIYLAQTDIDFITIGTYENLRNFDIKRYTEDGSGGASKGYYFSEKLLNMIKADDITLLRQVNSLDLVTNSKNIFSDIILDPGFKWNIHKPDVNKNYLLSISTLLKTIDQIDDLDRRKQYVLELIDTAIANYNELEKRNVFLSNEGSNYHLNTWKTYLLNS